MVAAGLVGGGALGAAGGALDANWWKNEAGIADEFVYEAGRLIEPGDSAIFALLRTADPDYVDAQFRGYGGIVLRSTLTKEQSDKVQNSRQPAGSAPEWRCCSILSQAGEPQDGVIPGLMAPRKAG
jgi:uncharacterized membrane protein